MGWLRAKDVQSGISYALVRRLSELNSLLLLPSNISILFVHVKVQT
jgi:hypothetical protein